MKKILILFAAILASSEAFAATATGDVRATVVDNITVSQTTALNFGAFSPPASGSGTITQAGTVTGGVIAVSSSETRAAGVFSVTGSESTAYNFTLPATATISSGSNQMTAALSFTSGSASRSLASGVENVSVNGTLTVTANQAVGTYTGTYQVTVNY